MIARSWGSAWPFDSISSIRLEIQLRSWDSPPILWKIHRIPRDLMLVQVNQWEKLAWFHLEASKVGNRDWIFREKKNFIRSDWRRKNWIWDGKNYPYPKQWKKNSNPTMLTSKYFLISFVEIPSWGQCSTPVCIARGPTELSWLLTQWLCPSFRGAWGRNSRMSKQFVNLGRGNRRAQGAKARDLSIFEPRAGNASFVF